jgi:hypothetical protein
MGFLSKLFGRTTVPATYAVNPSAVVGADLIIISCSDEAQFDAFADAMAVLRRAMPDIHDLLTRVPRQIKMNVSSAKASNAVDTAMRSNASLGTGLSVLAQLRTVDATGQAGATGRTQLCIAIHTTQHLDGKPTLVMAVENWRFAAPGSEA